MLSTDTITNWPKLHPAGFLWSSRWVCMLMSSRYETEYWRMKRKSAIYRIMTTIFRPTDTTQEIRGLVWSRMEKRSALHLEHLGGVVFALLFTERGIRHCSTFMNACDSHILDVSRMSKAREVRAELIPVSHGNPHPTCILSQRMYCNEHIYHNLHTKGHSSQDAECFCTLIN